MKPEAVQRLTGRPAARATVVAVVAGATGAQAAASMGSGVFPVIALQLAPALGVDPSFVGYQFSVLYGCAMAASTVVGAAVMRWGACGTMQIAVGLAAVGAGIATAGTIASIADRTGRSMTVLGACYAVMFVACAVTMFLGTGWPPALVATLFLILGVTAYGWNGVLHAQVARLSPQGMASVAMGGMMVWMFSGVLVGPTVFALSYRYAGGYASMFGLLAALPLVAWAITWRAAGNERRLQAGRLHQGISGEQR